MQALSHSLYFAVQVSVITDKSEDKWIKAAEKMGMCVCVCVCVCVRACVCVCVCAYMCAYA